MTDQERLRPLADWPHADRARVRLVLTDIDDTLTLHGRLPAVAYAALERLQAAGLLVVPVTGRPAGWCDQIARLWPVDGVVGENGAFWFRHDRAAGKLVRRFVDDAATRAENRERLARLREEILAAVPGCDVASDQLYREADLAIDFCEDVPPLAETAIDRIVALFEAAGAMAKVSSIHVNGWFGTYDKVSTARLLLAEAFALPWEAALEQVVYVGDSPNDQPMFEAFPQTVGVANLVRMAARMTKLPLWVTPSEGGLGFAEVADALMGASAAPAAREPGSPLGAR